MVRLLERSVWFCYGGWACCGVGCAVSEGAPEGLRAGLAPAGELVAQRVGAAEAAATCDLVDGQIGGLQQVLGVRQALVEQPAVRGGAGSRSEAAGEGAL